MPTRCCPIFFRHTSHGLIDCDNVPAALLQFDKLLFNYSSLVRPRMFLCSTMISSFPLVPSTSAHVRSSGWFPCVVASAVGVALARQLVT
eukprot:7729826-Pyramimonas_sp.AAC.1